MSCKIGKKLEWEDIKIGQAFYFKGCLGIAVKIDENHFFCIDVVSKSWWVPSTVLFNTEKFDGTPDFKFYDIPKELKECLEEV
jgi:hypothetical protein